jgi:hypothetical protein
MRSIIYLFMRTVHDGNMLRYYASQFGCDDYAVKMRCCPNMPARQMPRDLQEDARDVACQWCARELS